MKKLYCFILAATSILYAGNGYGQTCSCHDLLDTLAAKIETDYAGYIHKVKEIGKTGAYTAWKKKLEEDAAKLSFADCYKVLNQYINYFNDGHVYIVELPKTSPQ